MFDYLMDVINIPPLTDQAVWGFLCTLISFLQISLSGWSFLMSLWLTRLICPSACCQTISSVRCRVVSKYWQRFHQLRYVVQQSLLQVLCLSRAFQLPTISCRMCHEIRVRYFAAFPPPTVTSHCCQTSPLANWVQPINMLLHQEHISN